MYFVRRSLYHFLSVILFLLLLATAWSTSAALTFSNPHRVEAWLSESKLYDHFVDNFLDQSQGSTEDNSTLEGVPLSDTSVRQAANVAFTPQTVQAAVNTFVDANYAWLKGKT